MNPTHGFLGLTVSVLLSVPLFACSQVCGPLEYPTDGKCSEDGQTTTVTADPSRVDLRDTAAALALQIDVRRTKTNYPLTLSEVPKVALAQDGGPWQAVQVALNMDRKSVAVLRNPEQLALGSVDATVTIGGLPTELTVPKEQMLRLLPRIYRSPKFSSDRSFILPVGAIGPRSGNIRGRAAVQVAGPFSEPGRLLVTASVDTVVGGVRWLELFQALPGLQLGYDPSGVWSTEQQKQQEGPAALLAMGKAAILIYDLDMGTSRKDLSLIPFFGTRQIRLSTVAAQVPDNATALAACAEASLVFLAAPQQVQAFAFDLAPAALTLRHLGALGVEDSQPIVAARDIAGTVPLQRSQRYAAAVATRQGQVRLVPVTGDSPASYAIDPNGVRGVDLSRAITALALADLDSDGLQDLVFAQSDGQLGWLPQSPDGSFSAQPALLDLKVVGAASLSVGDLNGDSWPDLAVATLDKVGAYGNAQVFFNNPN